MTALPSLLSAGGVTIIPADQVGSSPGPLIAFVILAVLVLGGAIVTITRKNLVSAVMSLVATFFGIAGLYAMLSAHFLAAIQVLVYAGGIMVLFVFVVMVLNREEADPWALRNPLTKGLGVGALLYLVLRLGQLIVAAAPTLQTHIEAPPANFGTVGGVGETFFTDYLFPFEGISLLLLIAIIGAVVLARTTVARVTSHYELPEGETDMRQPQHSAADELVGIPEHGQSEKMAHPKKHGGGH